MRDATRCTIAQAKSHDHQPAHDPAWGCGRRQCPHTAAPSLALAQAGRCLAHGLERVAHLVVGKHCTYPTKQDTSASARSGSGSGSGSGSPSANASASAGASDKCLGVRPWRALSLGQGRRTLSLAAPSGDSSTLFFTAAFFCSTLFFTAEVFSSTARVTLLTLTTPTATTAVKGTAT